MSCQSVFRYAISAVFSSTVIDTVDEPRPHVGVPHRAVGRIGRLEGDVANRTRDAHQNCLFGRLQVFCERPMSCCDLPQEVSRVVVLVFDRPDDSVFLSVSNALRLIRLRNAAAKRYGTARRSSGGSAIYTVRRICEQQSFQNLPSAGLRSMNSQRYRVSITLSRRYLSRAGGPTERRIDPPPPRSILRPPSGTPVRRVPP